MSAPTRPALRWYGGKRFSDLLECRYRVAPAVVRPRGLDDTPGGVAMDEPTPSIGRLWGQVDPANNYASELAIGLAGEHVVCADLLAMGYAPFRTEQAAPYDIAVDVGTRIVRLQVKATLGAKPYPQQTQRHVTGYTWNMRHGKRGNRSYAQGSVDGFALVALDIRRVAYIHPGRTVFQLPISGARSLRPMRRFEDYTFKTLLGQP